MTESQYLNFFYSKIFSFIYFCLLWVSVAASRLSLVAVSGGCILAAVVRLLIAVASLLWSTGSRACGFSRCGLGTMLPHGMWDCPRPGVEPVSPALTGRFLIARPSGKSSNILFNLYSFNISEIKSVFTV